MDQNAVNEPDGPSAGARARRVRVVLVDDHPMVTEILRFGFALDERFEVCAVAGSPGEAENLIAGDAPFDVLITDVSMGGMPVGLELARAAKARRPDAKVVVLSAFSDAWVVREALEGGVDAYLLKTAALGEIKAGIDAVLAGEVVLDPSIHLRSGATGLTGRQLEILDLLAQGLSRQAMAEALHISENTLKSHVRAIFAKLGARTALEAVARAGKLGWTAPQPADTLAG